MAIITLPPPSIVVTELRTPFYVTEHEVDAWLAYELSFQYVRETQPNRGPEVEAFQRFCGGSPGDSWCDDFQCFCYCAVWPHMPLARSGRCQTTREEAARLGWLLPMGTYPRRGDLGLVIDTRAATVAKLGRTHAHHIFAVQSDPGGVFAEFDSSEGNTNPAGGSDGYGVFKRSTRGMKKTTAYQFIRFPRKVAA